MTATVFTSDSSSVFNNRARKCHSASNNSFIYQATAYGEDGEYEQFEVTAESYAQANSLAMTRAYELMNDVQYIDIQLMA